jgi:hypothetical protein
MNIIIQKATAEIGTKEFPADSNKVKYNTWIYGKEVSGPNYPWCGAFVSWVYDQAGMNLGNIGLKNGFVGCPYAVEKLAKWGKIVTVPEEGDVVFFDWQGDGKFDHTGIFQEDINKEGQFWSIEGNTALTNDSNGGEVMLRKRKYKNCIFVRPNSKKV